MTKFPVGSLCICLTQLRCGISLKWRCIVILHYKTLYGLRDPDVVVLAADGMINEISYSLVAQMFADQVLYDYELLSLHVENLDET